MTNGETEVVWHESVRCKEYYAEEFKKLSDQDKGFEQEFDDEGWICPKVKNITVKNDPTTYETGNGTAFYMVFNTCTDAKKIDADNNLVSYNPEYNC